MKIGRFELLDERIMGAIRFIDAVTLLPIRDMVEVSGARTVRNQSGFIVVYAPDSPSEELAFYLSRFRGEPNVNEPAAGTIELDLEAHVLSGRYMSRLFQLNLPRQSADPTQPDYLFDPVEVMMYPSPIYGIERQWAVIRVHVSQTGTNPNVSLGGVLVSAVTTSNDVLGRGLSDKRGETLIIVPGLRPVTFANPESTVTLRARRDNRAPSIPNPDQLLNAVDTEDWLETAEQEDVVIAPGRLTVDRIAID